MTLTLLRLKTKVKGQGQTLKVSVTRQKVVGWTSILNRGQFSNSQFVAQSWATV